MRHYSNSDLPLYGNGERYFLIPFLGGALAGSAAVGLTRPRPFYVNVAPVNNGFNPYYPSGNFSYSYYYPTYRPF